MMSHSRVYVFIYVRVSRPSVFPSTWVSFWLRWLYSLTSDHIPCTWGAAVRRIPCSMVTIVVLGPYLDPSNVGWHDTLLLIVSGKFYSLGECKVVSSSIGVLLPLRSHTKPVWNTMPLIQVHTDSRTEVNGWWLRVQSRISHHISTRISHWA